MESFKDFLLCHCVGMSPAELKRIWRRPGRCLRQDLPRSMDEPTPQTQAAGVSCGIWPRGVRE